MPVIQKECPHGPSTQGKTAFMDAKVLNPDMIMIIFVKGPNSSWFLRKTLGTSESYLVPQVRSRESPAVRLEGRLKEPCVPGFDQYEKDPCKSAGYGVMGHGCHFRQHQLQGTPYVFSCHGTIGRFSPRQVDMRLRRNFCIDSRVSR